MNGEMTRVFVLNTRMETRSPGRNSFERSVAGGGDLLDFASHAPADVEEQNEVEGLFARREHCNRLFLTVVEDAEVALCQASYRPAILVDNLCVQVDEGDICPKRRSRLGEQARRWN